MSNVIKSLYNLQQIDLRMADHHKRLDAIETALNDNAAVQKAQRIVTKITDALQPMKTQLRDLELQVQSTRQKRAQTEERLYSGAVSNSKELQDMQTSIEALKTRQSNLEDDTIELMMTVEMTEQELQTAQESLQQVQEQAANDNQDLLSERERLKSELETLKSERQAIVTSLPADQLAEYESARASTANRPIAALKDGSTCAVCGVQQTELNARAVRQGDEIIRCRNCNRILVAI